MERHRGSVVWFCNAKGFGFLRREGEPDVFCHRGAIRPEELAALADGEEVEFDTSGPYGLQAENVTCVCRMSRCPGSA